MFSLNPNFQRLMIIFDSFLFVACWSCLKIFRVSFQIENQNSGSFHHISKLCKNLLSYTACIFGGDIFDDITVHYLGRDIFHDITVQYFPSRISTRVMNLFVLVIVLENFLPYSLCCVLY